MRSRRIATAGQTATEYMLILSVVVIAVVAAAYKFVPLFQQGVDALGRDVKEILATGQLGSAGAGGRDMGAGSTARVASRLCDAQGRDLDPRYASMFDPPPCVTPPAAPWRPSKAPATLVAPPRARPASRAALALIAGGNAAALPRTAADATPPAAPEQVLFLSSARLGRRSRSRSR